MAISIHNTEMTLEEVSFFILFIYFFFFLVILGFELRASCLQGKSSSPFCSLYFVDRILLFAKSGLEKSFSYFILPAIAGMTGTCPTHSFFPLRWDLKNFFAWPGLKPQSS
jgi:hypothetical protein